MSDAGDRVVLVTGAAGALGRAVAADFAAAGWRRILLDRDARGLEAAFGPGDERQVHAAADLVGTADLAGAVDAAVRRAGRLDALVNVAGGFTMGEAVHETREATWDAMFDLNARSLLRMARAAVPHLLAGGGGRIVNVAAYAALHGAALKGVYGASKAVVIHLTESMSAELRERGINVNCVLPTILDTPANRQAMPDADPSRWVATEDLAQVILFLASDASRAVHGAALPVTALS